MPEVLWTICAILGVLVLAYLFTRYVAGRGQGGGPSRLGKRIHTDRGLRIKTRRGSASTTRTTRSRWRQA